MPPGKDGSRIRKPDGTTIYALLPKSKRSLLVPDSGVLYTWALEMMDNAGSAPTRERALVAFRDGVLLAMLASRERRLRSMSLLRVGQELVFRGDRYRVELKPDQVKTNAPDRFNLPDRLTPYIRDYLDGARSELLGANSNDALWVNNRGEPWTAKGLQDRVIKLTRRRFGIAFGPHRFRHAIATTVLMRDLSHPGVVAGLLVISKEVVEQSYNRAGQSQAAIDFDLALTRRRARLKKFDAGKRADA